MAYSIYNSWAGALTISVVPSKGSLAFNMAKPFNPQKGGKVEKGTKVYDWKNSVFFSMTIDECQKLLDYWKNENTKAQMQQPAFQENFHLVHSSGNNTNFLNFSLSGDKFYLGIGPKGNNVSMPLAMEQIQILLKACTYMTSTMPWVMDILKEQGKMLDHKSSYNPGNDMTGNPYQGGQEGDYNPNNGHGQYNNGGYQKRNYNNNNGYQNNYNQNGSYQQPQQSFAPPKPPMPAPVPQPVPQPVSFNPMPQPVAAPQPVAPVMPPRVDDFGI